MDVDSPMLSDAILYISERQGDSQGQQPLVYSFGVAPGAYTIVLHFADTCLCSKAPGQRHFDVLIEVSEAAVKGHCRANRNYLCCRTSL